MDSTGPAGDCHVEDDIRSNSDKKYVNENDALNAEPKEDNLSEDSHTDDERESAKSQNEHTPECSDAEQMQKEPSTPRPRKMHAKQRKQSLPPKQLTYSAAKNDSPLKKKYKVCFPNAIVSTEQKSTVNKKVKKGSKKSAMANRNISEQGTWVQCCETLCQKWRYLSNIHDPVVIPDVWVCSLNTDTNFNSCSKPEDNYSITQHEKNLIFTKYTEGSVVWARMPGYPWWPAMVETDPDSDVYVWLNTKDRMQPTHYHVVFFDECVSRAWVTLKSIEAYSTTDHKPPIGNQGRSYKKQVEDARVKADSALELSLKDRLAKYSFSVRFTGKWADWVDAEAKFDTSTNKKPKNKKKATVKEEMKENSTTVNEKVSTRDVHLSRESQNLAKQRLSGYLFSGDESDGESHSEASVELSSAIATAEDLLGDVDSVLQALGDLSDSDDDYESDKVVKKKPKKGGKVDKGKENSEGHGKKSAVKKEKTKDRKKKEKSGERKQEHKNKTKKSKKVDKSGDPEEQKKNKFAPVFKAKTASSEVGEQNGLCDPKGDDPDRATTENFADCHLEKVMKGEGDSNITTYRDANIISGKMDKCDEKVRDKKKKKQRTSETKKKDVKETVNEIDKTVDPTDNGDTKNTAVVCDEKMNDMSGEDEEKKTKKDVKVKKVKKTSKSLSDKKKSKVEKDKSDVVAKMEESGKEEEKSQLEKIKSKKSSKFSAPIAAKENTPEFTANDAAVEKKVKAEKRKRETAEQSGDSKVRRITETDMLDLDADNHINHAISGNLSSKSTQEDITFDDDLNLNLLIDASLSLNKLNSTQDSDPFDLEE